MKRKFTWGNQTKMTPNIHQIHAALCLQTLESPTKLTLFSTIKINEGVSDGKTFVGNLLFVVYKYFFKEGGLVAGNHQLL